MCKSNFSGFIFVLLLCMPAINSFNSKQDSGPYTVFSIKNETYYSFHNEFVNWTRAKYLCARAGGLLWVPEDKAAQEVVMKKITPQFRQWWAWTGINDLDNTGSYHNLEGTPINTDAYLWSQGELHPSYHKYLCVAMYSDAITARLGVSDCDSKYSYVCKF